VGRRRWRRGSRLLAFITRRGRAWPLAQWPGGERAIGGILQIRPEKKETTAETSAESKKKLCGKTATSPFSSLRSSLQLSH